MKYEFFEEHNTSSNRSIVRVEWNHSKDCKYMYFLARRVINDLNLPDYDCRLDISFRAVSVPDMDRRKSEMWDEWNRLMSLTRGTASNRYGLELIESTAVVGKVNGYMDGKTTTVLRMTSLHCPLLTSPTDIVGEMFWSIMKNMGDIHIGSPEAVGLLGIEPPCMTSNDGYFERLSPID